MIQIPSIKIPSVRVGSIGPTSNIGTGGATPAPPTPITYLTQWRMMGNSEVHTDEYLTQWKVEGNSVVDNNTILSCGDLGQDGKYHVKISNGVDVFDIALTEPLRKVNDLADNIEFSNGIALVTRNIAKAKWNDCNITYQGEREYKRFASSSVGSLIFKPTTYGERVNTCLSADFIQNQAPVSSVVETNPTDLCMAVYSDGTVYVRDTSTTSAEDFYEKYGAHEFLYRLATPTTEVIQAPQISVSPTHTYSSANITPYSSFTFNDNAEIWSCGEYSAVDNKWHIRILPEGYGVVDIALDEPLRKVNDVADSIEYADGVATLTRAFGKVDMFTLPWAIQTDGLFRSMSNDSVNSMKYLTRNLLNIRYNVVVGNPTSDLSIAVTNSQAIPILRVKDTNYTDVDTYKNSLQGVELIYEVATPTTETIQVPQIAEADTYTCEISQGGKAVEWSSFTTDNE